MQAGVPLGTTFSFLIASPLINEVALVLLLGMFGWKISLIYVFSGLIIAILSGIIIGKMKVENLVESFVYKNTVNGKIYLPKMAWLNRFVYAKNYTLDIIKKFGRILLSVSVSELLSMAMCRLIFWPNMPAPINGTPCCLPF